VTAKGRGEGETAYRGIEGLRHWAEKVDAVWADWHREVVDFREVGDRQAVAVIRATGGARESGVPLDTCTGNVLTWRHGKGWQNEAYSDPREALQAVGCASRPCRRRTSRCCAGCTPSGPRAISGRSATLPSPTWSGSGRPGLRASAAEWLAGATHRAAAYSGDNHDRPQRTP
jgi:ketosteroid isomerase-like protein